MSPEYADYLKKYENNELLAQINAACDDISSSEKEVKIVQVIKRKQKKILWANHGN